MNRNQFQNEPVQTQARGPVRISLGVLIICILLTGAFVFTGTFVGFSSYYRNYQKTRYPEFDKLTEIAEIYDKVYLKDLDKDYLNQLLIWSYLYGTGDQYSYYYTAEEWAMEEAAAAGASVGIGVYIKPNESQELRIVKVMQDAPAFAAGLQPNDVIVAIDGNNVKEIGYTEATKMLSGEIGEEITLDILRGEQIFTVTLQYEHYVWQTVFPELLLKDGKKIGYIQIASFMSIETTGYQFKAAVETLMENGAEGLVFDLRDNGGGDISTVVYMLDYLLPEGPIVHVEFPKFNESETYYSDASEIDIPMTVLVNGSSASASELFTAALRDYQKAEIIGLRTYGKGCGQLGQSLSDGSVIFITSFLYTPPFSENYEGIGIYPDHEVALDEKWNGTSVYLVPHDEDAQLKKAASVLKGLISEKANSDQSQT